MIYEIKNSDFSAKITSMGAELLSVKGKDGFEYIWQRDEKYWGGSAPVLFPIVGALRNGKTKIKDKWYEMGRHGFARKCELAVIEHTDDKISFNLKSNEDTKKFYPYDFSFTVTYWLTDSGINTKFSVYNIGGETLPFCVGGHPAFNIPVNENAEFEDYTIIFEKAENQACPKVELDSCLINFDERTFTLENETEIPLKHELFYEDALVFENLNSTKVKVSNKNSGRGVSMDFSGFDMLGIWSAQNDGPYVALEPWTGCATLTSESDSFEEKKNMTFLPVGEKADYTFKVSFF